MNCRGGVFNIYKIFYYFRLVVRAFFFKFVSARNLIGKEFDSYGRKISFNFLLQGDYQRFIGLLCNPVSIVRYFEFQFAKDAANWNLSRKWLDISSPRLFLLYGLSKYSNINLVAINPDNNDLSETANYLKILKLEDSACLVANNAQTLSFPDNNFDIITSISVIEHIPNQEAANALKEIYRVLKPGGKLILTFPCSNEFFEEWRDNDVYGLGSPSETNKYFFQRFYDINAIQKQLSEIIGEQPVTMQIFGEKVKGTFAEYEKRWMRTGLNETVKDPYYISKDYKLYDSIEKLPGVGVCGLIFQKGFSQ
jgi:ubiquinone/menaquinone biosynthesis C-methylase UbiE